MKIGIIGAGGIGRLHGEAAAKAGVTVAAFCDVDAERAAAAAAAHPGATAFTEVGELLAAPDCPAVVVAVPNALHKDIAIQALRAGRDVLLEKPMALNTGECDEIIAAAGETDRLVQLGFVCRCAPSTGVVERFIASGRLGRIYHARATWIRRRGIPGLGRWFTTKSMSGGGVLIDLGVHMIDLAMHLAGRPRPQRVSGVCTSNFGSPIADYAFTEMWSGPPRPDGVFDVEDAATALMRFDAGFTMELTTTWAANVSEKDVPSGLLLLGDTGGCFFDIWGERVLLAAQEGRELVDITPELPPGDRWMQAWTTQHERFAEAVRTRTPPDASLAHGREVQSILDAIYRSSEEGREVEI
jgi:predicted dehydrogenase